MTRRETREVALERRVGRIDAAARDAGHRPKPWETSESGTDSVANTRCEGCRSGAYVRVSDDGQEWQGGRLAWREPEPCAAQESTV